MEVFLNTVHALRIMNYTTDQAGRSASYGLAKPWVKIKVTFGDNNREETVLLGQQDKRLYGARQGEPAVYEFSAGEIESVQSKLQDLAAT